MSDFWSVIITLNYRIMFRFENDSIYDVDFLDYL